MAHGVAAQEPVWRYDSGTKGFARAGVRSARAATMDVKRILACVYSNLFFYLKVRVSAVFFAEMEREVVPVLGSLLRL